MNEDGNNFEGCGHGLIKVLSWHLSGGIEENHLGQAG
jgi:hypothetical protein